MFFENGTRVPGSPYTVSLHHPRRNSQQEGKSVTHVSSVQPQWVANVCIDVLLIFIIILNFGLSSCF